MMLKRKDSNLKSHVIFMLLTVFISLGIFSSNILAVDEGVCWVADSRHNQIVKLAPDGRELLRINGFNGPREVSVNASDGSCWVADFYANRVVKLALDGTELYSISGFYQPWTLSVNHEDDGTSYEDYPQYTGPRTGPIGPGACWVGDYRNAVKLTSDGTKLVRVSGFIVVRSISVNPEDDGTSYEDYPQYTGPRTGPIGPGACWVGDFYRNQVVKLAPDGTELARVSDLVWPSKISVNPADGTCWVAATLSYQAVKLAANGTELVRVSVSTRIRSVSVNPEDDGTSGLTA